MREYKKAIEYYEKALGSDLKTYGKDHPDVATIWKNMGLAWHSLGKYETAIEYYEKALKVFDKSLGKNHPYTITVRDNLEISKKELKKEIKKNPGNYRLLS